jgi:hypothetical protein
MKLKKFDLSSGWGDETYPFPHTLAEALSPQESNFAIVHAGPETSPDVLAGSLPEGYSLDFATGAKKHGDFIMSKKPIGPLFWATAEEAVAYGSNLLTSCWAFSPEAMPLTVLVVEDGEMGTGDCHGKASLTLWAKMGGDVQKAAQFRMASASEGLLAKGTLVVDSAIEGYGLVEEGIDLVLPVSAFKSTYKPDPGTYTWTVVLGIVAWSEVRPTKFSWQVLQWFSWEAIEQDLLPSVEVIAAQLLEAMTDTRKLAEHLKLDAKGIDLPFLDILLADEHGQLSQHPYVVKTAGRMLRQRWLHLALGAGQKFVGLMALPDDSLPFGVVTANDLPTGECIFTGYPLRYWGDLRIVHNAGGSRIHRGVVWMSHETAAAIGRDFDGDYVQLVPADEYPALADEIRSWADHPEVEIVKVKERLASPMDQESLARVMLSQAGNAVGKIALLIGRAVAADRLDLVPVLAQQLQISVDQFKYNVHLDDDLLVGLDEELLQVAWLLDRKGEATYMARPLTVQSSDTVGRLIQRVNSYWKAPAVVACPIDEYAALFPEADEKLLALAKKLNRRYGKLIGEAMKAQDDDERKSLFKRVFTSLAEWAEGVGDPEAWAAACWRAVHNKSSQGCGSLPFHAFPEQIAQVVAAAPDPGPAVIVGLKHNDFAHDLAQFDGSEFVVKFALRRLGAHLRTAALVDDRVVGFVSRETRVLQGTRPVSLTWRGQAVYAS